MTHLTMSMFATKADYEKAKAEQDEAKRSCPKAGKGYCEYPYCSCKEQDMSVIPNTNDIGC